MDLERSYDISDLRNVPEFCPVVAGRVWAAWWRDAGHPLDLIERRVQENLNSAGAPFALVAHRSLADPAGSTETAAVQTAFFGTASVIASDMEARPQYAPGSRLFGSSRPAAIGASAPPL